MHRAYVDTCLFIYWVERAGDQADAALRWLMSRPETTLCVSPLVRMELLVKPMRDDDKVLVRAYETLLAPQEWLSMSDEVFSQATLLRAQHGLKTPDALHLATALHHGCTEFWTNDDRLRTAAGSLAVNVLDGPL